MTEQIQFIGPDGRGIAVNPDESVKLKVGDHEFSFSAQFLYDFVSRTEESEVPLLIEALKKDYPNIVNKTDLLAQGVTIRNETIGLLVGTDDTPEKTATREGNLKNAKVKMDIYADLVKMNDTLVGQIQNIGGAAVTEAGEEKAERSQAQQLLKSQLNQNSNTK